MNSQERRKEILRMLIESDEPISGSEFAKHFDVTRQIIVKDIALIKAGNQKILSTARGYFLERSNDNSVKTTISVCHSVDDIEKELQLIVDLGGNVLTTAVEHPYYGTLGEAINIRSRKDIINFMKRLSETGCEPLLALTKGIHQHVIQADSQESLNEICEALKKEGYLI